MKKARNLPGATRGLLRVLAVLMMVVITASSMAMVVYADDTPTPTHEMKVEYVYADGGQAAEPFIEQAKEGEPYDFPAVPSPAIEGYTPSVDAVSDHVDAVAAAHTVTVTYSPVATAPDPALDPTEVKTTYLVEVRYVFGNGSKAADSWSASLPEGHVLNETVTSPPIEGFTPDQPSVTLNMTVSGHHSVTVTYTGAPTTFTVAHMVEKLDVPGEYEEHSRQDSLTGTVNGTPDMSQVQSIVGGLTGYEDYTVQADLPALAPNGGTEINVYYNVRSYEIRYDSATGEYIAPVSRRFGAALGADLRTPPAIVNNLGVTPESWTVTGETSNTPFTYDPSTNTIDLPANMPAENIIVTAQWPGLVPYTEEYYLEKADGSGYEYLGSVTKYGDHGTAPEQPGDGVHQYTTAEIFPIPGPVEGWGGALRAYDPSLEPGSEYRPAYIYYQPRHVDGTTIAGSPTLDSSKPDTVVQQWFTRRQITLFFGANGGSFKLSPSDPIKYSGTNYYSNTYMLGEAIPVSQWPSTYPASTAVFTPPAGKGTFVGWLGAGDGYSSFYDGYFDCFTEGLWADAATAYDKYPGQPALKAYWPTSGETVNVVCHFEEADGTFSDDPTDQEINIFYLPKGVTTTEPQYYRGFVPESSELDFSSLQPDAQGNYHLNYYRASYPIYFNTGSTTMYASSLKFEHELGTALIGKEYYTDPLTHASANGGILPLWVTTRGYEFAGWYIDVDLQTPFELATAGTMSGEALVLYAQWALPTRSVTFDYNTPAGVDAADAIAPYVCDDFAFGDVLGDAFTSGKLTLPVEPDKAFPGYTFLGWYLNTNDSAPTDPNMVAVAYSNLTFTARWAKADTKYTIEYRLKGTTGSDGLILSETLDGTNGETVTATARYFQHTPHAQYAKYLPLQHTQSLLLGKDAEANVIVFEYDKAEWSYTVRYVDADGNELLPTFGPVTTTKTYVTENYRIIDDYTPRQYQITQALTTNTVLTFVYDVIPPEQFTVVYQPGFAGPAAVQDDNGGVPYILGDDVTVLGNMFTRANFTFTGWTLQLDGSTYQGGSTLTNVQNNLVFVAQWAPIVPTTFTVTYMPGYDGGPAAVDGGTLTAPADVTVAANMFTRDGFSFTGWVLQQDGNTYQGGNVLAGMQQDLVFVAQWAAVPVPTTFTVTYLPGFAGPAAVDGGTYTAPADVGVAANMFARDGFIFAGWTMGGATYAPGAVLAGNTADLTFVATWIPDTFTVTYLPGFAGPAAVDGGTYPMDTDVTVLGNMFTREGFNFLGWTMGGGAEYDPGAVIPAVADDLVFVARWGEIIEDDPPPINDPPSSSSSDTGGTVIPDPPTPTAGPAWALLNLLLSILCTVFSILLLIGIFARDKKRNADENDLDVDPETGEKAGRRKSGLGWRVVSIIAGLVAPILFLLTEDIRLPMIFTDRWTLPTVIALVVQLIFMLLLYRARRVDNDEEDEAQHTT